MDRSEMETANSVVVHQAYRFALDPTPEQESMLRSHCGAQRYAYNWGLALVLANLKQREAERSYGIPDDGLTHRVDWSAYALRKRWNQAKGEVAPWWSENSKESYASGLANLATGLSNWSTSRSGKRKGPSVRFPRFKSKRSVQSCRFTTGASWLVDSDRRHVKLPVIGKVRTHESVRKLARRIDSGAARILSVTVSFRNGRWFVSLNTEVTRTVRPVRSPHAVVGVDLGLKQLAVLSQPVPGVSDVRGMVSNPRHLNAALRSMRRLQRQAARRCGPDKRTGSTPSARWLRTQAGIRRLHGTVADSRRDGLHKLTTALTNQFGTIVIEDLNVAGMVRNHRLARHISDAGWGELRRQLEYKTTWRGTDLVIADRWYPSSKTCNSCGTVKTKLGLSERVFRCDVCGHTADRDGNAAANLASLVSVSTSSSSCGATLNEPDGNPSKTGMAGDGYRHGKPYKGQRLVSNHATAEGDDGNGWYPQSPLDEHRTAES